MNKKTLKDIKVNGKTVLVRCDFNVPQDKDGQITNEARIVGALPTIEYLLKNNAKIILCSHLGRPKNGIEDKFSLRPIANRLSELLKNNVILAKDVIGTDAKQKISKLKEGEIVLLENVRFHREEEKNDKDFSKELSKGIDIYVNDAFGTAHRAHSSTAGVAAFVPISVCGFLIQKELEIMGKVLDNPDRPFIAIIGGAKVSDKIGVIRNLLNKVDLLLIGGAMAYTFITAKGGNVGLSLVEKDKIDLAKSLLEDAQKKGVKLMLPLDNLCTKEFKADASYDICDSHNIHKDHEGMDIGPKTIAAYSIEIAKAKTIVWNGPMGVFEFSRFANGTKEIAKAISSNTNCTSIIGGGDSAAAVEQMGYAKQMTHMSTGGGASLEYLEGLELPGIACLNDR